MRGGCGGGGLKQEFKGSLQVTVVCMLHDWHISRVGRREVRARMQKQIDELVIPTVCR